MAPSTKLALANSLRRLLQKKFLDDITVKEIVEDCEVNRQTFYYHFQDILDVIEWIMQRSADELLARSLQAENPKAALRLFIDFAMKNRTFIHHLLRSRQREQMENIIHRNFRSYLENLYRHAAVDTSLSYRDLLMALDFFTYGISGVLIESSRSGQADPEVLTDQLYRLLTGRMVQIPSA